MMEPAGLVAKVARHPVFRHDGKADLVGDEDDEAGHAGGQPLGEVLALRRHVAFRQHEVGDP